MLLHLIRKKTSHTGVMGQLWVIDHIFGNQLLCDTLEHVPGRSGIRIHAGNQSSDSAGCVLVGHAAGTRLTDSRKVEDMITKLLLSIDHSREDIRLEVSAAAE
ncbi:MAG: hypothetical protein KBS40_06375 [Bacteroidales bacterium]|nr:hypothetical protein [Bacteroidales bacterium]